MNTWQFPHLHALLQVRGAGDWYWQIAEDTVEGVRYWALVQQSAEGELTGCGVFAVGEQLTLQARVLALVTPAVLLDASERALCVEDAQERLQHLEGLLRRVLNRAYQHQEKAHYNDLRRGLRELAVARRLLSASRPPPLQELEAWERDAVNGSAPPLGD